MNTPHPPTLLAYKSGKKAWTTRWEDSTGKRQTKRFGMEGEVGKREANARYENWLSNEFGRDQVKNPNSPAAVFTVSQLADQYEEHAKSIYVKHGKVTSHVAQVILAMAALRDRFGSLCASDLDNPRLFQLTQDMIVGKSGPRSIKTVNGRLHCIKAAYKWARTKGLVTAACLADLLAVPALRRGRSKAKDPRKVKPVEWERVAATLQHCPPTLADLIQVQYLGGMRPGEACPMKATNIEMKGDVWLYRPDEHKTEHLGQDRVIPLGPKAQAIIQRRLTANLNAYLFPPAQAWEERAAARHEARVTPAKYGNTRKPKDQNQRTFAPYYDKDSYRKAIGYACKLAKVEKWHPHQLRHSRATEINKEFGIQGASVLLGHSNINTTQIYAEKNLAQAMQIAKQVG